MCLRRITPRRQTQDMGRLDEIFLGQKLDLACDQRRHRGDAGHAHDDHDVVDARLEGRDHEQDQHQARERIDQIVEIGDERLDFAAPVAGQRAERGALAGAK